MTVRELLNQILGSEAIKQPMAATIVALIFMPISVYLGFHMTSLLSRPILSIEYAYIYRKKELCKPDNTMDEIKNIIDNDLYMNYKTRHAMRPVFYDIAIPLYGNRIVDIDKFTESLKEFKRHALEIGLSINKEQGALSSMGDMDKQALAIRYLPNSTNFIDDNIDTELSKYYENRKGEIKRIIHNIEALLDNIENCNNSKIYINLSVLNNGSTDGLVRNVGTLIYRNIEYLMKRSNGPSSAQEKMAVPTYVVNKSFNSVQSESVGKIQKNSMVELWYELSMQESHKSICEKGGGFTLLIFDQDKSTVDKSFDCKETWR